MHPHLELDAPTVAGNFRAWRARAGVPVRAVIKCNAYNWGYARMIEILDPLCEEYCVADFEELLAARKWTAHTIVVLGAIAPGDVGSALQAGAILTIDSHEHLRAVTEWTAQSGRKPRIRVGVRPALGWSGLELAQIETLAPELAASGLPVEVWTHVTAPAHTERLCNRVTQAVHTLRSHGALVAATEVASTYPLASHGPMGSTVRVGIGLFGSTGSVGVEGVRCALRVSAPVVSIKRAEAGTKVGYGERKIGEDGKVLTVRCGYGDGLPKALASVSDILSVGMQYTTIRVSDQTAGRDAVALVDQDTNLDVFAAGVNLSPHEIVTAFGNARSATNVAI